MGKHRFDFVDASQVFEGATFTFEGNRYAYGERIDTMQDEDIDLSDIPEVTEEQMRNAVLRVGRKPVERGQRRVDILLIAGREESLEITIFENGTWEFNQNEEA